MTKSINWKKPGQIVKVGYMSNIQSDYFHRGSIEIYVDEHGNYFGCEEEPKFNPTTGKKIKEICYIFSEDREYESTDDEYEKDKKYTNKSK